MIVAVPAPVSLFGFAEIHAGLPVTVHSQFEAVVTVTPTDPLSEDML